MNRSEAGFRIKGSRLYYENEEFMISIIKRIRSGGQSGVDRAALDIARRYGVETCGWCPKGGWAEDYPSPPGLLADYPELRETPQEGTSQRTRWNMRDADAILTILPEGSMESPGTMLGVKEGSLLEKPMFTATGLEDVPDILSWLNTLSGNMFPDGIELCVGGPRASECGKAYDIASEILGSVLKALD